MKTARLLTWSVLLCASPAFAQMPKDVDTPKDTPAVLVNLLSVRSDCSLGTVDIPIVREKPAHGVVTLAATMLDVPSTGDCPTRRAPVIVVIYAPALGYAGVDDVAISISDQNKPPLRYRVKIGAGG